VDAVVDTLWTPLRAMVCIEMRRVEFDSVSTKTAHAVERLFAEFSVQFAEIGRWVERMEQTQ
jgi:hypothetical protein